MRNVALVCLDTVRKDVFDEYATRLRKRAGISYEQCRAASSWSLPSHASMFTGTLPHRHGVHDFNRSFEGLSSTDTFLADIPDHQSVGVSANVFASSAFGFDSLFDDFVETSPDCRFPGGLHVGEFGYKTDYDGFRKYLAYFSAAFGHDHPLRSLANGAVVGIERACERLPIPKPVDDGARVLSKSARRAVDRTEEPWFLFVNFMDAHAPLRQTLGYDRSLSNAPNTWHSGQFDKWEINLDDEAGVKHNRTALRYHRELYAAAVDYLDRRVSTLVDWLRQDSTREVTVVVTADHGENLGYESDDYLFGHDSSLSEGLLHVPCLVINPPDGYGEVPSDAYFSHTSLGDLLVGFAREEATTVTECQVAAELVGSTNAHPPEDPEYWTRGLRTVYSDREKVVWDTFDDVKWYRLDSERPCWQEEVIDTDKMDNLDISMFDIRLDDYRQRVVQRDHSTDVDQAVQDRLSDLGYV